MPNAPATIYAAAFSGTVGTLGGVLAPAVVMAAAFSGSMALTHLTIGPAVVCRATLSGEYAWEPPTGAPFAVSARFSGSVSIAGIGSVNQPTATRALLDDVLSLLGGCCERAPKECVLAEALRAANAGLQQFHLAARSAEFMLNPENRYWSETTEGKKIYSLAGVDLPGRGATDYGEVGTTTRLHHVARAVYHNTTTDKTHLLRPLDGNGANIYYDGPAGAQNPGMSLVEWLDTPNVAPTQPFFYEVFRDADDSAHKAKIRCYPFKTAFGEDDPVGRVEIVYYNWPAALTPQDYHAGGTLNVATAAVELYVMPLIRHAALSSQYFDHANESLKAEIKSRYREVLGLLGLGDPQPLSAQ